MTLMDDLGVREQAEMVGSLIKRAVDHATNRTERSSQVRLGVSEIGSCRERVRRVITGEAASQEVDTYTMAAFTGTAVGDHIENAIIAVDPDGGWVKQDETTVRLEVSGMALNIPGHPDIYRPTDLIDVKTKDGLGTVRRKPDQQHVWQVTLYAHGLIADGKLNSDAMLHLVYVDRSGADNEPVVHSWSYDPSIVAEASLWLDDVVYAIKAQEVASRDKPRDWCWAVCEFAPNCRGAQDTDVVGLIEDPVVLDAIAIYDEADEIIKAATKDKNSAASILKGLAGNTATHTLRTITVDPTDIQSYTRAGYSRIDLRRKKTGR